MFLPKATNNSDDFITPEAGLYSLEFIEYDGPKVSKFLNDKGEEQQCVELIFQIVDDEEPDYNGIRLRRTCGWSMGKKAILRGYITALLGHDPDPNEDISLDDLIGTKVQGTIVNVTKDGQNPGEKVTYANIQSVTPLRRRRAQPAPAVDIEPEQAPDPKELGPFNSKKSA